MGRSIRSRLSDLRTRLVGDTGDDETAVRTDGGATVSRGSAGTGLSDRLRSLRNSRFVGSLPFWLPPFLLMGLFVYGAIGWNFLISLTDMEGFGDPDYSALDFQQYAELFGSQAFIDAARNTFVLLVAFTILCLVLGLVLAILLDRTLRLQNTFRLVYLLPFSLSFVVTAQLWAWMYDIDNGIINSVLSIGGLQPDWIGNPQLVLGAVSSRWSGSSAATRWWSFSPDCRRSRTNTSRRRVSMARARSRCTGGSSSPSSGARSSARSSC
ncbi:sugar ABC transporter permease [Halococcus morrhuae DSM 1307]|uniref:Sugar ABC transporter permease n=1 Tax=Halococcus morrhuae DSM 1307 TaxID=931277 RepID=M0MDG7_HALMO|nr:sugar ABC transporter permease [Halococcus morrhuae DSM 1307]